MRTIGISLIIPLDSPIKDQFQSIIMIMTIVNDNNDNKILIIRF